MQIVGTTILKTSFMDGIWELTTWEFKEGFEDVPHPLSMSHHRTLADVGICMPDATLVWPTSNMHVDATFTELGPW